MPLKAQYTPEAWERSLAQARAYKAKLRAEGRYNYPSTPEQMRAQASRWRKANPEKHAAQEAKRRARKASAIGQVMQQEWEAIRASQNDKCAHCGNKGGLEMDHVIPLSAGGCHMAHNLQGLCKSCNSRKKDKIMTNQFSLFDKVSGG